MARQKHPIIIALGGNALKADSHIIDYPSLSQACEVMAGYVDNGLLVTHGNGPQIGILAEKMNSASRAFQWPLDIVGAGIEGMLGYIVEQALSNSLPENRDLATLLTWTEVETSDEYLNVPVKPIGSWLSRQKARELTDACGWTFLEKGGRYRRLVPSPYPKQTCQLQAIKSLVDAGITVICAGGGGIPVMRDGDGKLHGIEAVIDKDLTSSLLGRELQARLLVLATDVDGVYRDWEDKAEDLIEESTPNEIAMYQFPEGSMGPKVEAACRFVNDTGSPAVIGALSDLPQLLAGSAGTRITNRT